MSILLDQLLTTADEFDPLGFVVRGVLPVVAAPPGRPALQQGQRLLRRLLFARHVRHKTFEVFYKNIITTLLFRLVLGNMPPVGSRGLVPQASISRDLPLSTTWGRAGSGLVAPCEVGKWLLPHLPDVSIYVHTFENELGCDILMTQEKNYPIFKILILILSAPPTNLDFSTFFFSY